MSRIFLVRNLVITFAMVSILGVLDTLSNADLLPTDAGAIEHLQFMLLRAPLLYERIFIFTFLMSLLVTYVVLIRRNELVAITSSGMSAFQQMLALAPAAIFASVVSLLIIDQAGPSAQQSLINWLGPEAAIASLEPTNELWLADGDLLVRIEQVSDGELIGLTLLERLERGIIESVSYAESAVSSNEGWRLEGVTQVRFDDGEVDPPAYWNSTLTPETIRLLSLEPRYLSVTDLWQLSQLRGSGNRSSSAYQVWFFSRLALPFVAITLLIFTVSIMQRFGRDPKPELALVGGMAVGVFYVVIDNISNSLPENTGIDPAAAALTPALVLLLLSLAMAIRKYRV